MSNAQRTYSDPIILEEPIQRGDKQAITEVRLRKPKAGELRGLNTVDLLNGNINSTIKLVPRLADPMLTEQEVANVEPADLVMFADAIATFLLKKERMEASPEM